MKHKWKHYGKQWTFCVKCGMARWYAKTKPCIMTDKTWKQNYSHMFEHTKVGYCCVKCGIRYGDVVRRYRITKLTKSGRHSWNKKELIDWACSAGSIKNYETRMYNPSIKFPCTMSHKEGYIKSIIE